MSVNGTLFIDFQHDILSAQFSSWPCRKIILPLPRRLKRRGQRLLTLDDPRAIKRPYTNVGRGVTLFTLCVAAPLFLE